jgi:cadmium resistance protein CadD (predicted permease)
MTAADAAAIALLTLTGFLATNLDNLLILVSLVAAGAERRSALLGYLAAAATVLAACILGGALGSLLRPDLVGYLGIVPLSLGLWQGWNNLRGSAVDAAAPGGGSVFFLTLSNSGDNVALFLPLIAETERESALLLIAIYLVLILAWAGLAHSVVRRPMVARTFASGSRWLLPCILVGVGTYILFNTGTDTLA